MKNTDAYYRAIENMLNLSVFKNEIINIMPLILNEEKHSLIRDTGMISIKTLQNQNVGIK